MSPTAQQPSFQAMLKSPALFLGLGLGSGLAPKAPGTFGTLLGFLLFLPLIVFGLTLVAWIVLILGLVFGSYICGKSAELLGVHDHGGIVWDEFVGIWLVLLLLPEQSWLYWIAAFLAFRFFDILKPWPIKWLDEKVAGGLGIMLDDLVAALIALAGIWVLYGLLS